VLVSPWVTDAVLRLLKTGIFRYLLLTGNGRIYH